MPQDSPLVIEARVDPDAIDDVEVGQEAIVNLVAFDRRNTPELNGAVRDVSADVVIDEATGSSYYAIAVELLDGERDRLGGLRLVSGMPVEVFVTTGARSPLDYLLKPLRDQIAHAWKEP